MSTNINLLRKFGSAAKKQPNKEINENMSRKNGKDKRN